MRRWRKMTWALWAWTIVMWAWIIGGIISNSSEPPDQSCVTAAGSSACETAGNVGTGIAVALLITLWVFGFVVLGLVWFMTRPKGRPCPVCGEQVKRGLTTCKACGYDFAAAARAGATPDGGGGARPLASG